MTDTFLLETGDPLLQESGSDTLILESDVVVTPWVSQAGTPKKPPLALSVEVETSDGTSFDLGPYSPAPDRPLNAAMGSQRGDGFAEGNYTLSRDIWRDYADLSLYDTHRFVGVDGSIAYEGRMQSNPRSIGQDGHKIAVQLQGWMTHMRDRPFRDVIVDRDFTNWLAASVQRRLNLIAANDGVSDPTVTADPTSGAPSLELGFDGAWSTSGLPVAEALYDAGAGVSIASLYLAWKKSASVQNTDTNWSWSGGLATTDTLGTADSSGELRAAGPGTATVSASAADRRFAYLRHLYGTSAGGAAGVHYAIYFTCAAVLGGHGLPKLTALDGSGAPAFAASDIIRYLTGRYAKKLSASGVQSTSYPIPQAAWREPTDPYDALVQLNDLHLWELNVFEGPTLSFRPADLTTVDWEVRAGEDGTTVNLDGDSAGPNGVIVVFTDYSGAQQVIYPTDYPGQLLDPNLENPATKHGIDAWGDPVQIPYPCDAAYAVQVGRAVLAERLLPKAPGTITVQGHIRDAAGNWQQGWKVRNSQTVAIANAPNDRARLITDARWDPANEVLTMTVERPSTRIEGLFNRTSTALKAANLS